MLPFLLVFIAASLKKPLKSIVQKNKYLSIGIGKHFAAIFSAKRVYSDLLFYCFDDSDVAP